MSRSDVEIELPTGLDLAPGSLVVEITGRAVRLDMIGGGGWTIPVGVDPLVDGPLERADLPRPEQLTNALGTVTDHLDDVLIEAPIVAATPAIVVVGPHAEMIGRVEIGDDRLPPICELARADVDEVFRTVATETRADRLHNPGLDADHVDTIVAACCIVLALLRRLDHQQVVIVTRPDSGPAGDTD